MPSNPKNFPGGREDDDEDRANRRAAERVRQAKEADDGNEPAPRPDDEEEVELEVGGGGREDDDEGDEEEGEEGQQARGSRRDRRRERGDRLFREERERSNRLEQQLLQNNQMLQQLAARGAQPPPAAQPKPEEDPLETEALTLRSAQEGLVAQHQAAVARKDAAEVKRLGDEAWKLKDRLDRNATARHMKALGYAPGQGGQQPNERQMFDQAMVATTRAQAMQRYGDVLGNQQAATYYRGEVMRMLATGKPDDWETHDQAAEAARKQFRMPSKQQRPAPTAAERARLTGVSRGAGAQTGERSRATIKMTKDYKKMADAAYPHIRDPQKRYQKWVNGPGKRLVEKGQI